MVSEPALRAAAQSTLVLEQTANLSVSAIVVQVRATAVDLMRGWGLDRDEAERRVQEAARVLATGEHRSCSRDPGPRAVRRATAAGRRRASYGGSPSLASPPTSHPRPAAGRSVGAGAAGPCISRSRC